jgi:hypothetical protein
MGIAPARGGIQKGSILGVADLISANVIAVGHLAAARGSGRSIGTLDTGHGEEGRRFRSSCSGEGRDQHAYSRSQWPVSHMSPPIGSEAGRAARLIAYSMAKHTGSLAEGYEKPRQIAPAGFVYCLRGAIRRS